MMFLKLEKDSVFFITKNHFDSNWELKFFTTVKTNKYISTIIGILLFHIGLYSQSQFSQVLSPHQIWFVVESSSWASGSNYNRNKINLDSVLIGNNFYHKVLRSTDSTGNSWFDTKKYTREFNGQLWVLDSTINENEVLVMDLNLNKGDEFSYMDRLGRAMNLLVTKSDTIIDLRGHPRKVLYLSCAENESFRYRWIEGIGPDVGLFSSKFNQCVVDGDENSLTCFYTDDLQIWQNEDYRDCWKPSPPIIEPLLPILNPRLTRYVVTREFFSPQNKMERWKFDFLPEVFNAGKAYYELLVSDQKEGNVFSGSGRYFRETDNRFYQYISPTEGERLLYDMNLSLGDSIKIVYEDGARDMVVTKEDSVAFLDQKIRKRLTLQCVRNGELESGDPAVWIEGFGRFFEPFVDYSHCSIWDNARPEIICIYDGSERLYNSEVAPDDCWINPLVIDTTDMDRSTVWFSSSYSGNYVDGDCEMKIDITKVVRDTTIVDRVCRIIGVFSGGTYLTESEIITFQKADKLYFYEDDEWKLLYDFTAQIADTVTYSISKKYPYYVKYGVPAPFDPELIKGNPYQLVIKNIDTIYDNSGKPLKWFFTEGVFNVHGHFMGEIIENIGSKEKLFGNNVIISLPECSPFKEGVGLRCYSNDDISIKFTEGECDKLTSTKDLSTETIKIYPNPGQDRVFFTLSDGYILPVTVQMADITGKILMTDMRHLTNIDINTNHLNSGLYFITIRDSRGKLSSGKWVKE